MVDEPKDRDADRVCRRPEDSSKDAVLVATGDSVTSAYHQTRSAASTNCAINNSAKDHRNLPGNDMFFSYAGRYYRGNANISEYYNFARTGFDTDDVRTAVAARTDACANPWNRVKPPLGLAEDAIKDAKTKNKKAFAVVTGGINNTNWTDMIKEFAVCRIAQLATEAFKATALSTRDTHFRWFARGGGGPLNAPNDKIMENGGGCWAVWFVRRPFFPPVVLISRWGISQYNGPGSAAPGRWVPQIPFDAEAIVKALLNAGADKVVWMLYYDMIPATIDSAAFARSALRNAPVFQWAANAAPRLFNLGNVSLLPDELSIEKVQAYEKALNDAIKARFPVNAKLVALRPPMLFRGDIQNTAALGCPHPNAEGHKKLAATLKTVLG